MSARFFVASGVTKTRKGFCIFFCTTLSLVKKATPPPMNKITSLHASGGVWHEFSLSQNTFLICQENERVELNNFFQ
jgi:hypothetical protein